MQSSQDSLTVEDSDTQSLTASVTDYPIEHGRRYHRYHEGGMLSLRLGGWFTINRFWLTRCLSIHLPKRRAGTRSSGHAASHVQTRKWGSAVLFTSTKSPADSRHRHRLWDLADGNGYAPLHFLLMTCSVRHLLYSTPNRIFYQQNEHLLMTFLSCSIHFPTNRDYRNRPFTRPADRSARKRPFPRRRLHRRRLVMGSWPFWLHPHLPSHWGPALVQSPAPQGHEASQTG